MNGTRPHRRVQPSLPRVHSPSKGPCSDSCRAPASPPHLFVNSVLRVHGLVKGGVFAPGACDIAEVAQSVVLAADASAPGQGFNCHFVQAFVLLMGSPAKSFVQNIRHVANSVLHANIVGIAGNECKRCCLRTSLLPDQSFQALTTSPQVPCTRADVHCSWDSNESPAVRSMGIK